ncbi:hypothetical protein ACIBK9_28655 [Nonomuraea sp. NPDC050227]|uniref:hypothetical protein n=1 Tax=Nonomuraea sp. NPDC050227 TaxID=3364360 RepID=UPI00378A4A73
MRLVQAAVGPPTDSGHLAEAFLGGLMLRGGPADPVAPAQDRVFDFSEEARRILLGTVPPYELLRTTRTVTEQLGQLVGRSRDFPAWLRHPQGIGKVTEESRPFGWLDARLMARLGVPPVAATAEPEVVAEPRDAEPQTVPERLEYPPTSSSGRILPQPTGQKGLKHYISGELELAPPWSPLLPEDPRRAGPYRLYARNSAGWQRVVVFLARDEAGRTVTVRVPFLDQEVAKELVRTEAEALIRMAGIHAPRLLGRSAEDSPPWLAAECARGQGERL